MFEEEFQWKDVIQNNKNTKVPSTWEQAINIAIMKRKLEVQVKKIVEAQVQYYNAKHQQQKYNIGDKVFFDSQNIKLTWPSKKLDLKYCDPYKIIAPISKQAYRLALPSSLKIYNICKDDLGKGIAQG